MCTMAWDVSGDELWVCFNRDESRQRSRAQPPELHDCGQHRLAFARDPEGGGTWLAVSSAGFIVALMNKYEEYLQPEGNCISRGSLVLKVAQQATFHHASKQVRTALQAEPYSPFYLFLLSTAKQAMYSWNGNGLTVIKPCPQFWTTSSHEPSKVYDWRRRAWASRIGSGNVSLAQAVTVLRDKEGPPAFRMTMDRPDARTVSQSTVRLDEQGMAFTYSPRQPDGEGYEEAFVCRW